MTEQPVPSVTAADLARLVRREFPADRVAEVSALLAEYGSASWHAEAHRVRAAALKLAAGNLRRLRQVIESAKADYRDVLAYAEYPTYFQRVAGPGRLPAEEERRIVEADWKQYQEWFGR